MKKRLNKDRLISVASVVVAIISVIVAIWAIKVSKNIAVQSGSFDKPILEVLIGNNEISKSQVNELVIGLDVEKYGNEFVVGGIPIAISNSGKKSLKGVNFKFSYHESIGRQALELMEYNVVGGYHSKHVDRHFSKMGSVQVASYYFPQLDPQGVVEITDPLVIAETRYKDRITLDNGISFTATVDYGLVVEIGASALDMVPIVRDLNVSVINATSLSELQRKHRETIVKNINETREEAHILEYLESLVFGNNRVNVSYVYPEIESVSSEQVTIYEAEILGSKLHSFNYEVRQWRALFN